RHYTLPTSLDNTNKSIIPEVVVEPCKEIETISTNQETKSESDQSILQTIDEEAISDTSIGYFGVHKEPKYQPWTEKDRQRLREAVDMYEGNWAKVANYVSNGRTSNSCFIMWNFVLNHKYRGRWTKHEDQKLEKEVKKLAGNRANEVQRGKPITFADRGFWIKVCKVFNGQRSFIQCYSRWMYSVRCSTAGEEIKGSQMDGIKIGAWGDDELKRLEKGIRKYLPHLLPENNNGPEMSMAPKVKVRSVWKAVAEVVKTRNEVQCRLKWTRGLGSNKKANRGRPIFDYANTKKLFEYVEVYGRKWNKISQLHFPEYPPAVLGNRYKTVKVYLDKGYTWTQLFEKEKNNKRIRTFKQWSPEEKVKLVDLVAKHGDDWYLISQILGNSRTIRSCKVVYKKVLRGSPILARALKEKYTQ
ncbi:hypothetical protein H4219_005658, partial [Mycoemilia scoparia]